MITAQTIALLIGGFVVFVGLLLQKNKKPSIKIAERIQVDAEKMAVESALKELEQQRAIEEREASLSWFERKQRELAQSNTGITFPAYMVIVVVSMLGIFLLTYKITAMPLLAIPVSFLGLKIPEAIVQVRIKKNVEQFNNDLVKALRRMASVIRAGGSLKQALMDVTRSRSMPTIIRVEFKKVLADIEYGYTIEEALYRLYERTGSPDVRFLAIAVEIQRQLGGNIAQIFDSIGQTINNRNLMQSEVKATLAQVKASSTILSIVPFALGGLIYMLNPGYFDPLFASMAGRMLVFICISIITMGAVIIKKMSNIEL